ncbi:hypothetical protein S83_063113, partial [Arachis hypogaea]
ENSRGSPLVATSSPCRKISVSIACSHSHSQCSESLDLVPSSSQSLGTLNLWISFCLLNCFLLVTYTNSGLVNHACLRLMTMNVHLISSSNEDSVMVSNELSEKEKATSNIR